MGFNFRKSVKMGPVRVNLSKSGVGYSVGGKGMRVTKKAGGGTRTTVGIPGTGISYSSDSKKKSTTKKTAQKKEYAVEKSRPVSNTSKPTAETTYTSHAKKNWPKSIILTILAFAATGAITFVIAFLCYAFLSLFIKNFGLTVGARILVFGVPVIFAILAALIVFFSTRPEKEDPAEYLSAEEISEGPEPQELQTEEPPQPESEVLRYYVAGVEYYLDALKGMMVPNTLYAYKKQDLIDIYKTDEAVYKTTIENISVELVPEPDNPHDPKAIKVLLNGVHVGYIPAKRCAHLLRKIGNHEIENIAAIVGGGKYKKVNEDYDFMKDKSKYTMETGEDNYYIELYIREKL